MIQTMRQIKSRIKGAENIKKITRAMEMVSAAKLNRVKKVLYASRPYFQGIETMLKDLIADVGDHGHPLLTARENPRGIVVCAIASDTGLCGTYNNNLLRFTGRFLNTYDKKDITVVPVGKEAFSHFSRLGFTIHSAHVGSYGRYSQERSDAIARDLIDIYSNSGAGGVYVVYTRFDAAMRYAPAVERFLNIEPAAGRAAGYLLEPAASELLKRLVPVYLLAKMRSIMLEAFTSEHTSRMFAMKTATDNAVDMIAALTLARNKARQFAITKEVLEIAMSAEAVKG